jgi:hypothetical protein
VQTSLIETISFYEKPLHQAERIRQLFTAILGESIIAKGILAQAARDSKSLSGPKRSLAHVCKTSRRFSAAGMRFANGDGRRLAILPRPILCGAQSLFFEAVSFKWRMGQS